MTFRRCCVAGSATERRQNPHSGGQAPPTANHQRTDPEIALDVIAGSPRSVRGPVLSNSFGFGGHNATLVVGPPE